MKSLKEYRLEKKYSCQHMADLLNISKSYYWQLEQNKRKLSYELAFKIAQIFEVKPDIIFYDYYKKNLE